MATKVKLIADGVITPDQITLTTASTGTNTTAPATTAFVQQEISALVDSSPDALNTLNELAAALGDDANFSTTVTNSIATKLPLAGGTMTGTIAGFTSTGIDDNATSTAITIDSSGNVLVGTTDNTPYNNSAGTSADRGIKLSSSGWLAVARDGQPTAYFNRTQSDGDIIDFRKNGSTVGSIGAFASRLYIGNDDTFLTFEGAADKIYPAGSSGASRDNAIDLGGSSARFKDLHLRGSVYADLVRGFEDTDTYVNFAGSNVLGFITGASERMRIDSSGDVRLAANATGAALIKGVSGNQTDRDTGGYPQFTFVGNEGTGMRRPITNVLAFDTSGAERMRIDSSGNVGLGTASPKALSGQKSLTINASVPRIDFKVGDVFKHHILCEAEYMSIGADADNGQSNSRVLIEADNAVVARFDGDGIKFGADSAAANALDDYEEGTWTPALSGVTTTSSTMYGIYTKIGNICHIHAKIEATVASLPGATFVITGIPFTAENASDANQRAIIHIGGDAANIGSNAFKAHFRTNSTNLSAMFLNSSTTYMTYNTMDHTTFELNIHGFYRTT